MHDLKLTSFQTEMREKIFCILERNELHTFFEQSGINEKYLHARIDAEDVDIWIYEDEAELRHHGRQFLCEKQAYKSEDLLKKDFLEEVRRILQKRNNSTHFKGAG